MPMISGSQYPLSRIFSQDFEFIIPQYQRPYAWQSEQAQELFEDLTNFAKDNPDTGSNDCEEYFLGSIVLIKEDGRPRAEVIDGQQRLTTLTILMAVLIDFLPDATEDNSNEKQRLKEYIIEPGNDWENLEAKPRLTLRERDRDFFERYVQGWQLNDLGKLDVTSLNDAQRNIQSNATYFRSAVAKTFTNDHEALINFIRFLLQKCFLVAVSTPNRNSAFRIFSVMNSRGVQLRPTDIIKADIIGNVLEADQSNVNETWEQMEADLGREGFNELFSHIRMIYAKDRARKSLLEEFRQYVLIDGANPEQFVVEVLEPYSKAYHMIRTSSYEAAERSEQVNELLTWLNRLEFSDWVPPAIAFISKMRNRPDRILLFFRHLERLAAWMLICGVYVSGRTSIFAEILRGIERIEQDCDVGQIPSLSLDDDQKQQFLEVLDGDVYTLTPRKRNYIILRLDSFISDGGAVYDPNNLTIEHVLPRCFDDDSEWAKSWPDEEYDAWVNRIANLVPLNRRRNSSAQNYPFKKKCKVYFSGNNNVSSYALTSQVLSYRRWTPKIVENRQSELLEAFRDGWKL